MAEPTREQSPAMNDGKLGKDVPASLDAVVFSLRQRFQCGVELAIRLEANTGNVG
jgi:hypothetical protein